jgi:hypothetical protein
MTVRSFLKVVQEAGLPGIGEWVIVDTKVTYVETRQLLKRSVAPRQASTRQTVRGWVLPTPGPVRPYLLTNDGELLAVTGLEKAITGRDIQFHDWLSLRELPQSNVTSGVWAHRVLSAYGETVLDFVDDDLGDALADLAQELGLLG